MVDVALVKVTLKGDWKFSFLKTSKSWSPGRLTFVKMLVRHLKLVFKPKTSLMLWKTLHSMCIMGFIKKIFWSCYNQQSPFFKDLMKQGRPSKNDPKSHQNPKNSQIWCQNHKVHIIWYKQTNFHEYPTINFDIIKKFLPIREKSIKLIFRLKWNNCSWTVPRWEIVHDLKIISCPTWINEQTLLLAFSQKKPP